MPVLEQTLKRGEHRIVHRFRWLHDVPLRDSKDAMTVNWFEMQIVKCQR